MTTQCPYCTEEIDPLTIKCKLCSEMLGNEPQRASGYLKTFSGIILGLLLIAAMTSAGCKKKSNGVISDMSFEEFDAVFCDISQQTDVQKQKQLEACKGLLIRWTGIVEQVENDEVGIKHKGTTLTSDVRLEVASPSRDTLSSLRKGELITYEGEIRDAGGLITRHRITDGKIISHRRISDDKRVTFLLHTAAAVVERVAKDAGIAP